ncbi:MAG: TonB-dependent receptor, partial [Bryobacteraceae bacterium]|nr:TonB-dependent receptor [Bryobacteraceae bacterium]
GQRFEFTNDFSTNTYLTRADWQASSAHRLSLRFNKSTWRNPFGNVGGTAHPSQAARQTRDNHSFFTNWNWAAAPSLVSEVKYGYNYFQWTNSPYVNSPEFRFPGGITVGGAYNYPQEFNQNTHQVRNDLYWMKGSHSVKFGGEYLANNHTGLFQQNVRGLANPLTAVPANLPAVFPTWNDPRTWNLSAVSPLVSSYVQGFGNFNIDIPRNIVGFWVQDDWKVTRRLTLNLGIRYDNDLGIWSTPALKSGVLPARGGQNTNFGPRVGFALDVFGDRKTVIRGGGGLYFADIQANQVINQSIFNGESSLQVSVNRTAASGIDLNNPFGQYTAEDYLTGRAPTPVQNLQLLGKGAQTPYSAQASIGVEREFRKGWTVSGDFVWWRIYHDWVRQDQNIFYNPATLFGTNPTTAGRPDPRFGQILIFTTPDAAGSIYTGGQFEVTRRLNDRFQLGAAYTFARLKDSTNGAFGYPNNQYDLADEWGNSLDDQRHTLNFDGSARLPWGMQSSLFYHLGSGAAFASIAPGNPFNYVGTSNRSFANGTRVFIDDEYLYSSRAPGFTNVKRNSLRGKPIHRMDWRFSKSVAIRERWRMTGIFEVFNVLNYQNYGTYLTNTGLNTYGRPAYNANLAYAARMLQFAARFDF